MLYQFEFRPIARKFARSLVTSHGVWDIREAIILRLCDGTGKVGWGEIAPISWFGSETLEQALDFCHQLPQEITAETIYSIPDHLPACQFGFESALEELGIGNWGQINSKFKIQNSKLKNAGEWGIGEAVRWAGSPTCSNCRHWALGMGFFPSAPLPPCPLASSSPTLRVRVSVSEREANATSPSSPYSLLPTPHSHQCPKPNSQYSALLPAGEAALSQWQTLWQQGYNTFKWKIGVNDIAQELKVFDLLTQALPASAKLRLDANGGLSYEEAKLWLQTCDNLPKNHELASEIEFIEQPLPVAEFPRMLELSESYATAIALDESVATLKQLAACYEQGWRGIFVIKPAIAGYPSRLRRFCQENEIDAVFSSVFETAIARQAALQLAAALSRHNRAVGFGINHFFMQEENETWLQSLFRSPESP